MITVSGYTDNPERLRRLVVAHNGWFTVNPYAASPEVYYSVGFEGCEDFNAFSRDMDAKEVREVDGRPGLVRRWLNRLSVTLRGVLR
jgi:hypothetical protein